jgi:hypothetical protein
VVCVDEKVDEAYHVSLIWYEGRGVGIFKSPPQYALSMLTEQKGLVNWKTGEWENGTIADLDV